MIQDVPRLFQETHIGACNIYPTRLPKPTFAFHHRTRRKRLPVEQHHQPTPLSLSHQPIGSSKIFFDNSSSTIPAGFRPIRSFSRKLSLSQRNYTTLEKELLSIVETLVEYRTILYGNKILAFMDHRNLTFDRLSSQRALCWCLLAEEFNITIIFRQGASNLAVDAISRLALQHMEQTYGYQET